MLCIARPARGAACLATLPVPAEAGYTDISWDLSVWVLRVSVCRACFRHGCVVLLVVMMIHGWVVVFDSGVHCLQRTPCFQVHAFVTLSP